MSLWEYWRWLLGWGKPKKVCGFIIVSDAGRTLTRERTWAGGYFSVDHPEGGFVHPRVFLADIRRNVLVGWAEKPKVCYAAIYDPATEGVTVTGGPFGFWELATWQLPPGGPTGLAPCERPWGYFSFGQAVWILLNDCPADPDWRRGLVVSFRPPYDVYVVCDGIVRKAHYGTDWIWPRAGQ